MKDFRIYLIVAAASLLLCGCKKQTPPPPAGNGAQAQPEMKNPAKAPDFRLKNHDGNDVSLSDYRDKIVVLAWFNYDCPFCQYHYQTAHTMATLADKYGDKGVIFLAINSTAGSTPEKNKQVAETHKLPYPILDDSSGKVGRAYGALTTPHMFVIDRHGTIVYNGAIDNAPMGKSESPAVNYVDQALAELLAGKEVTTGTTKPYGCSVKYTE